MQILNKSFWVNDYFADKNIPAEFAEGIGRIYTDYYYPETETFDYAAFAESKAWDEYATLARALTQFQPETLRHREQQLAFWLNVYNMLMIHGTIAHEIKRSVQNDKAFFHHTQYGIGEHVFNLDDIEHGILRGNAKKYHGLTPLFSKKDPRLALAIHIPDPRIHFALYSACKSSARWNVYYPETIDEQLNNAVRAMLRRDLIVDSGSAELHVPKVFQWYEKDFGGRSRIVGFITEHLNDEPSLQRAREAPGQVNLHYLEFDWGLNRAA